MKKYCDNCKKETETIIKKINEEYEVLGEKIKVETDVLTCKNCGQTIFDEVLDEDTLKKVYDIYKQKHHLLSSNEIIEIRKKYGLSQRALASLLGWGDKTIFRYEKGSIQDRSHNFILEQIKNEKNMLEYINKNKDRIDERIIKTVLNNIDSSSSKTNIAQLDEFDYAPTIYSGYKKFDNDKICGMIEFFVEKFGKIQSVKLLKLINYADMLYFKENSVSISGIRYKHCTFGPIPENYNLIFHYMLSNDMLEELYETNNDYEYHYYKNIGGKEMKYLSKGEINVLELVYKKFKNFGSKEISDYSHNEKGYKETKNNELISYIYANDIELSNHLF